MQTYARLHQKNNKIFFCYDTLLLMFYVVGLGNPGTKYTHTRHNVGWMVCDALVAAWALPTPQLQKKMFGRLGVGTIEGTAVSVLYPDTFMNNSGAAVRSLVPKDAVGRLILIYDDIAIPQGTFKISFGGGAGGHNGVQSVIDSLGNKDFTRVRIGIATTDEQGKAIRPPGELLSDYVLEKLLPDEQEKLKVLLPTLITAVTKIILETD